LIALLASRKGVTELFVTMLVIQGLGLIATQAAAGAGIMMFISATPVYYIFAIFYTRSSIQLIRWALLSALRLSDGSFSAPT